VRQQTLRIGTWLILLVAGDLQQTVSETERVIRSAVDQHFALMPEIWRAEFSRRLAGRIDDPRVAASTRAAVLAQCAEQIEHGTTSLMLIQHAAQFFPAAAPPEETIQEGSRLCAVRIEAELKNMVLYAPLSEAEHAERRSDLKLFEREALRVLDERIVGDDRARGIVAARVAGLFELYAGEIGKPTRILLNRPLPAGTFREVVDELEKSFPREKKYVLTGLTGDRDTDATKLQEQGVDDLIYEVVVGKIYVPLLRASWADQAALKESLAVSPQLQDWELRVRESIRVKASEQKIEADKLRALLDPPSRVPRPVPENSGVAAAGTPPARRDRPQARDGTASSGSASAPRSRGAILAAVALAALATLVLLRRNRGTAA
jgi:hypothetical protein